MTNDFSGIANGIYYGFYFQIDELSIYEGNQDFYDIFDTDYITINILRKPPTLNSPQTNSQNQAGNIAFSWIMPSGSGDADHYTLYLDGVQNPNQSLYSTSTYLNISQLNGHNWYVKAYGKKFRTWDNQVTQTSSTDSFSIANVKYVNYGSQLTCGQTMPIGGFLTSPSGRYTLVLQTAGNLVLYDYSTNPHTVAWATGNGGITVTGLTFESGGNLVLYNGSTPQWVTGTYGTGSYYFELQDDGNAVIYNTNWQAIWSTRYGLQNTSYGGHVLSAGQSLPRGGYLTSASGAYTLVFQYDNNVVIYDTSGHAYWSTQTSGKTANQFIMQSDGNLVLYNGSSLVWSSGTSGSGGYYLNFQDPSGSIPPQAVIYQANWTKAVWSSYYGRMY